MTHQIDSALVWFRRDLRCDDHAALYYALKEPKGLVRLRFGHRHPGDAATAGPPGDLHLRSLDQLHDGLGHWLAKPELA